MSIAESDMNSSTEAEQEKSSNFLLDNLGQFADGTPLSVKSIRAWRQQSLETKVERNFAQLDRLMIPWDSLYRKVVMTPLEQSPGFLLEREDSLHEASDKVENGFDQPVSFPEELMPRKVIQRPVTIFLHVPKSGGTTLEYLLGKNYSVNRSIHINAPELEKKPYLLFKHNSLPTLIMGHHKISSILYQLINRPIIHLTMLRDPVRRVISYYDYRRSGVRHSLCKEVKKMSLQEFVESDEFIELENAQARRLIGNLSQNKDRQLFGQGEISSLGQEDMLEAAKHTLVNCISFFGITEDYTRFLLMGKKLLKWRDIYYSRRNISQNKTSLSDIGPSVIELIRERNQVDIMLYDFAKQVFEERCQQLGIFQDQVEIYESLNKSYQDLLSSAQFELL